MAPGLLKSIWTCAAKRGLTFRDLSAFARKKFRGEYRIKWLPDSAFQTFIDWMTPMPIKSPMADYRDLFPKPDNENVDRRPLWMRNKK